MARYIGAKDQERLFRTVHTVIAIALYGGVLLATAGWIISGPVLELMQPPPEPAVPEPAVIPPEPTVIVPGSTAARQQEVITVPTKYDHLKLGVPGPADTIIDRPGYALGYIEYHEQPAWVVYRLTKDLALTKAAKRNPAPVFFVSSPRKKPWTPEAPICAAFPRAADKNGKPGVPVCALSRGRLYYSPQAVRRLVGKRNTQLSFEIE